MAKRIVAMLIMSLLSLQANAARYDRQCEGISPVLFQKKLKELAHGLRQEMAEPTPPTENEAETLARLAECDAENAAAQVQALVHIENERHGNPAQDEACGELAVVKPIPFRRFPVVETE